MTHGRPLETYRSATALLAALTLAGCVGSAPATWTYMLDQDYGRTVPEKGAHVLGLLEGLRDRHAVVSRVEGLGLLLNLTRPYSTRC